MQRAEREVFVISQAQDGWRVRSARNPSRAYSVAERSDGFVCTCPDFDPHVQEDPNWMCKHILAVQDFETQTGRENLVADLRASRCCARADGSEDDFLHSIPQR